MVLQEGWPVDVGCSHSGALHRLPVAHPLCQPGDLRRLQPVAQGLNALRQRVLRHSLIMPACQNLG